MPIKVPAAAADTADPVELSATSAARSATSPVNVPPVEPSPMEAVSVVRGLANRPATLAVDTVICPATAPKARSVTTVVRSDIFPANALASRIVFATSASSLAM